MTRLVGPVPPGADPDAYDRLRRRVLWRLCNGLYLLGSAAGGRRNVMTISWVTQVATEPKLVAVSVETAALTHALVAEGGAFSVSILAREDRAVVRHFVKPLAETDPAEPGVLGGEEVFTATTGSPILTRAVAWLDCEVRDRVDAASHTLYVGEVVAAGARDDEDVEVLRMEDTRMSYGG